MRILIRCILFGTILAAGLSSPARAEIPSQLTWQGVALDSNDAALATGVYTLHFYIYSDDVGGLLLWSETQSIFVENGVMSVNLGKLTPIPDSVFDTDMRFLEVQFEDQAPYAPRSRIVSVGYSYRTSSVDGALAGTLHGDLTVEGAVHAPTIRVTEGGPVDVLDGVGNVALQMAASVAGDGGLVTIASDPSLTNGITLEGNAEGSGEPRLAIVGSDGAIVFDLRESGDASLQLPPDAIAADETKDEPGIASGYQPGVLRDIGSEYTEIATASADLPASGYVLVMIETTLHGHHDRAPVEAQLLEDDVVVAEWLWNSNDEHDEGFNLQSFLFTKAVPIGLRSYTLRIRRLHDRIDAADSKIVVVYLPTSYGTVAITGGPASFTLDSAFFPIYQNAPALNVGQNRDAALIENQTRIERELDAMAARMDELRAMLRASRQRLDMEP